MSRFFKAAVVVTFVVGSASAQEVTPAANTAPAPAAQEPAPPTGGPSVELSVKQRATLGPQETLAQARDYQRQMGEVLGKIQALQESARRAKDIIKLNCVTDKLIQGKVNLNIADQAMSSLQENTARGDDAGRQHEFTRLTILNQRIQVLRTEAENCIGEDLSFVGAARVEVEVDPSIPTSDLSLAPVPIIDIQRPPPASPYM